jgi:hypothetical protein
VQNKTWAHLMVEKKLNDPQPLLLKLDSEDDEFSVRRRLDEGKYSPWEAGVVEKWLRIKSEERASAIAARSEAREEEALSAAKEANRIASRAERWAMYAAIIAIVGVIISIALSSK